MFSVFLNFINHNNYLNAHFTNTSLSTFINTLSNTMIKHCLTVVKCDCTECFKRGNHLVSRYMCPYFSFILCIVSMFNASIANSVFKS